MECNICGKKDVLVRAEIEGAILEVCQGCARYGKILSRPPELKRSSPVPQRRVIEPEDVEAVSADAGEKIRKKREKLGLTQEQLARKVAEKESIVQKIETWAMAIPIVMARKFEKQLSLHLVEEAGPAMVSMSKTPGSIMTIGDLIKKKEG